MLIQRHLKDSGERVVFKSNVALIGEGILGCDADTARQAEGH